MRVVLRFRLAEPDPEPGGPTMTDAVGEVLSMDSAHVVVETRRGVVTVDRARVVAARQAPPAPTRTPSSPQVTASSPSDGRIRPSLGERTVTHGSGADRNDGFGRDEGIAGSDVSADALQELMTNGMPPLETERLGGWLLRAADGYTGRANSVLPLGDPGLPLASAVDHVCRWYAARGIPPLLQLPHPIGADPLASELGTELVARGARPFLQTFIMTRATPDVVVPAEGGVRVTATDEATSDWWAASSPRSLEHRETLARILALVPDAVYLTAYLDEQPVGHARLAFTRGWSGIFDIHTEPAARRQGVARALLAAADDAAREARIPLQYLQVALENTPAVRLYDALGWRVHHEYHYARFDKD